MSKSTTENTTSSTSSVKSRRVHLDLTRLVGSGDHKAAGLPHERRRWRWRVRVEEFREREGFSRGRGVEEARD